MPEQVDDLHDAAYWRALLGRCQGAEVLQVREMESHEEFWADWLRQDTTNTPSATARPWRPEVFELHRHGAAEEAKDSKAPEANGFGGLAVWGGDRVGGQMT
mgnify:FL=1